MAGKLSMLALLASAPQAAATGCGSLTYGGDTYNIKEAQELVDTMWDSAWENYTNVYDQYVEERGVIDSMAETKIGLLEIKQHLSGYTAEDVQAGLAEEISVIAHVKQIETKAQAYKTMIDVIAAVVGTVFIFVARFGYLARSVGMATTASVKSVISLDIVAMLIGVLGWWIMGYGFAFGSDDFPDTDDGMGFVGSSGFMPMLWNEAEGKGSDIGGGADTPENAYAHVEFLLHMGLSLIVVCIPVGTLLERANMQFTILCAALTSFILYPTVVHMIWDENGRFSAWREKNLFFDCGVLDLAGSGVIHATAGIIALSAAVIIDARPGRWKTLEDAKVPEIQPKPQYSPAFEAFGCTIIFVTSLAAVGFSIPNYAENGVAVGRAMLSTLLSAGTSSFTACVLGHYYTGVISPQLAGGGLIAGVACISSGCALVQPEGAFVMGFIGGCSYYFGGSLLVAIRVDDVTHAISMHGFAGIIGLVMTGLFTDPDYFEAVYYDTRYYDSGCYGMFYNGGPTATLAQGYAAMTIIAYVGTVSTLVFGTFHLTLGGRYRKKVLEEGIDSAQFGGETQFVHSASVADWKKYKKINDQQDGTEE